MGNKIRVIIAIAVIVGVAYWAISSVVQRNYSGTRLSFEVGSGSVVVTNRGQEPAPVEMRAEGRASTFRIESTDLDLRETSKREGTGRDIYHAVSFELPPGTAQINVTRGSNVQFISNGSQRIDAVVTPMDASGVRWILIVAGLVILGALYYISRIFEHRWIGTLRSKLPIGAGRPKSTAA